MAQAIINTYYIVSFTNGANGSTGDTGARIELYAKTKLELKNIIKQIQRSTPTSTAIKLTMSKYTVKWDDETHDISASSQSLTAADL